MTTWTNWARTATASPQRLLRPRNLDEITTAVRQTATAGMRLRPLGSGHSFTAVAATDSVALDLSEWAGVLDADSDTGLVTVRSGTTLRRLNTELAHAGLAMTNLGDIDVQTIAGAVSTGTHGTGARFGGLATQIRGLQLAMADGSVVTCSETERPELFAAARVGLGALGVIITVTLQCEPAFVLEAREGPKPLDAVLEAFDEYADGNDHFEFYWFPYGRNALVKRNNRVQGPAEPLSKLREFVDYTLTENAAFAGLCRLGRAVPTLVPTLGRLSSSVLSSRSYSNDSHRVFTTQRSVRFVESEWAVPRETVGEVLQELRALVPTLRTPVTFPAEVRIAAADDVWLSTAYGRDTAYVAVHQYAGMPYREYFEAFAAIAGAVGGRPHWGKLHDLDAAALRERYPRFDDFLRVAADVDPAGVFRNGYLDRVLGPVTTG